MYLVDIVVNAIKFETSELYLSIGFTYITSLWWLLVLYRFQTINQESTNMLPDGGDQCEKCGVVKRPDIQHCDECGICIEGYDHHCVVVGVCIGDVSFRYFVQFMAYAGLMFIAFAISLLI